jgi:hypothetical protein
MVPRVGRWHRRSGTWRALAGQVGMATGGRYCRRHLQQPARRRPLATAVRRFRVGLTVFVGLIGLTTAAMAAGPRWVIIAVGVAGGAGLLAAGVVVRPRRLAPSLARSEVEHLSDFRRLEATDRRHTLRNELVITALQPVAVLAVLAGAFLAFQQLTEDRQQTLADRVLTRQGQAGERFTRAVDQLGNDRQDVQLGGMYGLGQIARQDPDSRLAVTDVLVAYLRRRAASPAKPPPNPPVELGTRAPDVQAALTVLGRPETESVDSALDFRGLYLSGANLVGADLSGADLTGADLTRAFLNRANLTGVGLGGATLERAELIDANLTGANLSVATLSNTRLIRAKFTGAQLDGTVLRGADLTGADFTSVDLEETYLTDASADHTTRWPSRFNPRRAGVRVRERNTHP